MAIARAPVKKRGGIIALRFDLRAHCKHTCPPVLLLLLLRTRAHNLAIHRKTMSQSYQDTHEQWDWDIQGLGAGGRAAVGVATAQASLRAQCHAQKSCHPYIASHAAAILYILQYTHIHLHIRIEKCLADSVHYKTKTTPHKCPSRDRSSYITSSTVV